jgi:hypothetical protein
MRMWLALLAGAAVLVGCGLFFAFQDLGRADQYASIASFFLALLTTVGSLLALARSKPKEKSAEGSKEHQPAGPGPNYNVALWNENVQQGPWSVANVTKIVIARSRKGAAGRGRP